MRDPKSCKTTGAYRTATLGWELTAILNEQSQMQSTTDSAFTRLGNRSFAEMPAVSIV
jgi:hypothetical protein